MLWANISPTYMVFLPLQLDPQTVETKNWHTDVIEMNGVSLERQEEAPIWGGGCATSDP